MGNQNFFVTNIGWFYLGILFCFGFLLVGWRHSYPKEREAANVLSLQVRQTKATQTCLIIDCSTRRRKNNTHTHTRASTCSLNNAETKQSRNRENTKIPKEQTIYILESGTGRPIDHGLLSVPPICKIIIWLINMLQWGKKNNFILSK